MAHKVLSRRPEVAEPCGSGDTTNRRRHAAATAAATAGEVNAHVRGRMDAIEVDPE